MLKKSRFITTCFVFMALSDWGIAATPSPITPAEAAAVLSGIGLPPTEEMQYVTDGTCQYSLQPGSDQAQFALQKTLEDPGMSDPLMQLAVSAPSDSAVSYSYLAFDDGFQLTEVTQYTVGGGHHPPHTVKGISTLRVHGRAVEIADWTSDGYVPSISCELN